MTNFVTDRIYDYFDLGDESDQEGAESSEDEIDIILHGTPEQRRRLRQSHAREQQQRANSQRPSQSGQSAGKAKGSQSRQGGQSSSEDEFEKEMNAELDKTVSLLEKSRGSRQVPKPATNPATAAAVSAPETSTKRQTHSGRNTKAGKIPNPFYDDVYFDSDDDENYEGEGEARVKKHHSKPSNDDLLYDPDMDEEDQRWVDRQRKRQHANGNGDRQGSSSSAQKKDRGGKKRAAAPKSDAVLDCPACMTTLCLDCQRHDIYPNQFRAMFVMNCKANRSEVLSVPEQAAKKKWKKKSKKSKGGGAGDGGVQEGDCSSPSPSSSSTSADQFHPVLCEECDTVVGVVDVEEVYHFFNVLVSRS